MWGSLVPSAGMGLTAHPTGVEMKEAPAREEEKGSFSWPHSRVPVDHSQGFQWLLKKA